MYTVIPLTETIATSNVNAVFAMTLAPNRTYEFTSDVACYVSQGAAPVAVAGAGINRAFVPAGRVLRVRGDNGVKLAVILAAGTGFASLAPVQE